MADILIVEDDVFVARLLNIRLQQSGHLTTWVADGRHALTQVQAHLPDLILLDVMLPGMNGFQVAEHLKHDPVTSHIPIVIISAGSDSYSMAAGRACGAALYLTKPFSFPDLLQQITTVLADAESAAPQAYSY